jgi:UDP-3-O-[3-hydroxymyristoyl] glucosamine N-acyltransferase
VIIERDATIHDFVTIYQNVSVGANVEIFEGAVVGKPPSAAKAIARRFSVS